MGFVTMNLGDVVEPKAVPAGRYDLTISTAEPHTGKTSGGEGLKVSIGIDGHLDAPNVTHFISYPKPGEEPSKSNFKKLMLKRFLRQFGVPFNETEGFNIEDLPGCTAKAMLTLSEPDESGSIYNRLQLEKLPSEAK